MGDIAFESRLLNKYRVSLIKPLNSEKILKETPRFHKIVVDLSPKQVRKAKNEENKGKMTKGLSVFHGKFPSLDENKKGSRFKVKIPEMHHRTVQSKTDRVLGSNDLKTNQKALESTSQINNGGKTVKLFGKIEINQGKGHTKNSTVGISEKKKAVLSGAGLVLSKS